ncbi:hypothetical protein C4K27_1510 [Pseudomonas chlororaphis subsp. chlororaphis]|nr:hypothetical protein C4K27_1510 [Pseudomonas chlororaphis subsp. chlororaphis]
MPMLDTCKLQRQLLKKRQSNFLAGFFHTVRTSMSRRPP